MGLLTQPISCIGLPVCAVPVWPARTRALPIGVQVIAAPWREDLCLRVAAALRSGRRRRAPVRRPCAWNAMTGPTSTCPTCWPKCAPRSTRYEDALVTQQGRRARRAVLEQPAHPALRRRREPVRLSTRSAPSAPRARRRAWRARCCSTVITTYGRDFATANDRVPARRQRRASAARARPGCACAEGWRVVAAHVSLTRLRPRRDPTRRRRVTPQPRRRSLAEHVYPALKAQIYDFELVPGDRFTETEIGERLGDQPHAGARGAVPAANEGFVEVGRSSAGSCSRSTSASSRSLRPAHVLELAACAPVRRAASPPELDALKAIWLVPAPSARPTRARWAARRAVPRHLVRAAGNAKWRACTGT